MAISRIKKALTNLPRALKVMIEVIRKGGYSSYNIIQVDYLDILRGKRILVTGGSVGIGLSIARKCIDHGARVVITGRSYERLMEAKRSINSDNLHVIEWDVSNVSIADSKLGEIELLLGGEVNVLINNAGVIIHGKNFISIEEKDWDNLYSVNSKGLFFLTQAISKRWIFKKISGIKKIINISSQGGFVGATNPYRMTKWDVAGLTQGLAHLLSQHDIIVNGVAPGIVITAMQPSFEGSDDNIYYQNNRVKRASIPDEIAEVVFFLISDASNFVVGQTIVCDGGYSLNV